MKTDRELLELAAKALLAAGMEKFRHIDYSGWAVFDDEGYARNWNPLQDDGDALRLAVKLGIAPIQYKDDNVCAAYWTDINCCFAGYKSDPVAATRRAIVRAAAQMQLNKDQANG